MGFVRRGVGRLVVVMLMAASTVLVALSPAHAAAPPGVSNLAVTRYDHTLALSWYNPAAAYGPGASVVVRFAVGRTAPAGPTSAYAATVSGGRFATVGSLKADSSYTFAVWVRNRAGQYSPRRTLTTSTRADVTAPGPVTGAGALGTLVGQTPTVTLSWSTPSAPDLAGTRVVRNTSPTPTGGQVLATAATGSTFRTVLPSQDRSMSYWFYLAAKDTTGHFSPYVLVPVRTPETPASSALAGTVRNATGSPLSDISVQHGDPPPMQEGQEPPTYPSTDVRGVWSSTTRPGDSSSWTFFADYSDTGPTGGLLPLSHRPYGVLAAGRSYPVPAAGEFRTIAEPVVVPAAAAVQGVVRRPDGQPLGGISIGSRGAAHPVTTDSSGRYLLYGIFDDPPSTSVYADGSRLVSTLAPYGYSFLWNGRFLEDRQDDEVPVARGRASSLDFTLSPRGRVAGTVSETGVVVFAYNAEGGWVSVQPTGTSWRVDLAPGDYTLCAGITDHQPGGGVRDRGGCWDGSGTVPWTIGSLPPGAVGKTHVAAAQQTSGVDLVLPD